MLKVSLDRERSDRLNLEHQQRQKVQDIIELQAKFDALSAEMNARFVINFVLLFPQISNSMRQEELEAVCAKYEADTQERSGR